MQRLNLPLGSAEVKFDCICFCHEALLEGEGSQRVRKGFGDPWGRVDPAT